MKIKFIIAPLLLLSCASLAQQPETKDPSAVVTTQDARVEKPQTPAQDTNQAPKSKPEKRGIPVLKDLPLLGSLFQIGDENPEQALTLLWSDFSGPELDQRVTLDVSDMPIEQALQLLFDQVKLKFQSENDVPKDVKVTLKLNNVRFATALSALTESAGIGWQQQHTVKDNKVTSTFKVGKKLKSVPGVYHWPTDQKGNTLHWNGSQFDFHSLTKPNGSHGYLPLPGEKFILPHIEMPALPQTPIILDQTPQGAYTLFTQEERHTFTCPHCKQQVTILGKRQAPKCEKCGRTFQNDWQFCPFDGAKRPASPDSWQFCPHCGKRVS